MFGQPSIFAVLDTAPTTETHSSRDLIKEFLLKHEPEFARLNQLREKGWEQKSGSKYFKDQYEEAMTADPSQREMFYQTLQDIAAEMNDNTGALSFDGASTPQVLDLCMAPGGYSATILRLNPTASIDGISLPSEDGGHEVLIPFGSADPRVSIVFTDITMLATEYGVDMTEIPTDYADAQKLTSLRPYQDKNYDLVLCDGQVLYGKMWHSYRGRYEETRLTMAQLLLGLQRIKSGGTLIILLHRLDTFDSVMLIRSFCTFAKVELFKPKRANAVKSSFYMVAKDVQPHSAEAEIALKRYKRFLYNATFRNRTADRDEKRENVKVVLEEFGPKLRALGRRIWTTQADALETFIRDQSRPEWEANRVVETGNDAYQL